jgi:hypothetical protein
MQGADTIEKQADVLRRGGKYKEANELLTSGLDREIKKGTLAGIPGAQAKTAAETKKLQDDARIKGMTEVASFPDAESANAAIDARLANKIIDQATADQMRQGLTPENFIPWQRNTLLRMLSPEAQLKQGALTYIDTDLGSTNERQAYDAQGKPVGLPEVRAKTAAPRATKLLSNEEFEQQLRLRQEGRPPAQPRAEQPPVAVIDSVTGRPVLVSREEAVRGRMTPAAAMESLPPKEIQKREAALPQATSAVKGFESKSDKFIADLTALRDDTGLENITGPVFGRTGSVSQAGSRAQALYDKVVAKGGFQALQDLRDASKTGGALGNVSNQEGKQLTASFAAIDRRQNADDVRAAINQAIADIQGTKTRMREAYDMTYSYRGDGAAPPPRGGPPAKPAAGGVDKSNPLLK